MHNLLSLYQNDPDVFTALPISLMQLMSEVTADTHTYERTHLCRRIPCIQGESVGVRLLPGSSVNY